MKGHPTPYSNKWVLKCPLEPVATRIWHRCDKYNRVWNRIGSGKPFQVAYTACPHKWTLKTPLEPIAERIWQRDDPKSKHSILRRIGSKGTPFKVFSFKKASYAIHLMRLSRLGDDDDAVDIAIAALEDKNKFGGHLGYPEAAIITIDHYIGGNLTELIKERACADVSFCTL